MTAVPVMLRDFGELGHNEKLLFELGCTMAKTNADGNWSSLSYMTEVANWFLKNFTPRLDSQGAAWVKTSGNIQTYMNVFETVSTLLENKKQALKDPQPNPSRILLLASVIQKWNILGISRSSRETDVSNFPENLDPYWKPLFQMTEMTIHEDIPG